MRLADCPPPGLLLDLTVLDRNCATMGARAQAHEVRFRPHLKTAKSAPVTVTAFNRYHVDRGDGFAGLT